MYKQIAFFVKILEIPFENNVSLGILVHFSLREKITKNKISTMVILIE